MSKSKNAQERFRSELEELGETKVREMVRHAWASDSWQGAAAAAFLEEKDRGREELRFIQESKAGTGVLRAARDANTISREIATETARTRRWMMWTAVFTGITALVTMIALFLDLLSS